MKFMARILASLVAVSCLAFCFSACGDNSKKSTDEKQTVTVADTTSEVVKDDKITEDEALNMVKSEMAFGDNYGYYPNGEVEINGESYYEIEIKRILETHSSRVTIYFVKTDGSKIVEGYYEKGLPELFY